ncbi:MAG: hypothetical protein ABSG57_01960 [Candidatus Bathyarchaeia archaeon]
MNSWRFAGFLVLLWLVILGIGLYMPLAFLAAWVPGADHFGTTSQEATLNVYVVPWFFQVEFGFVVIGVFAGLGLGSQMVGIRSQTILKSWRTVEAYIISAIAVLGVSLYLAMYYLIHNLIYQLAPKLTLITDTGTYDLHAFIQKTILSGTIFYWFFGTAFFLVVIAVVLGILVPYMDSASQAF